MRSIFFTFLFLFSNFLSAGSQSISTLIKNLGENSSSVGVMVGVIDNGEVEYFSYGTKNLVDDDPVTKETLFEIASITKTFTALLLMDQVEKEGMGLDDPIELYLPNITIPEKNGKKITLRHLATHSSGLPCLPTNLELRGRLSNPYKDYGVSELYAFLESHSLENEPGEKCEYSNLGVGLLGHILYLKTGQTYESLIKELCATLGMQSTCITIGEAEAARLAIGHHMKRPVDNWDFLALEGAGAIRSSAEDLIAYLKANIASHNLLKLCHQKQREFNDQYGMGLGWLIADDSIIWHNGATGGYRSFIGFDQNSNRGVVILTNSTEYLVDELGFHILNPEKYPIKNLYAVDEPIQEKNLSQFEGCFEVTDPESGDKWEVEIALHGKQLIAGVVESPFYDFHNMPEGPIYLLPNADSFFYLQNGLSKGQGTRYLKDHCWRFCFEDGKVVGLQLIHSKATYKAKRV